ncbi:Retrovirus-related Pol polyprotein from transposon TNT 1-94 [Eumeta japonica]|uniref:Retrovirus-related Pol polyprotein from transposon TNT 1-94 n=1 Tax=Eumeta variegata TaxID=151549 RepID=A0A4C1UCE1_EUMVA|nr:Retrovirus-related Pol polyprotein from transposon TNT 1-94 [Eumeta japonica]
MQKTKDRIQSNAFSAVFLSGNFKRDDWYIDSGASVHLTANESWVMNAKYEQNKEIVVANSEKASVLCCGEVKITTTTDNHEYDIVVKDVMCVPSLTTNLLSVSQLIKRGNSVSFTEDGCLVHNQKNDLVATAVMVNGVYRVNLLKQECLAASVESVMIWHRRLGHVNKDYLNQMPNAVQGMSLKEKADISKSSCTTCCEGKQCRLPFKSTGHQSSNVLDIVHTDIWTNGKCVSWGSRYFLLFVDDYSRMTFVYFLKHKNEALKYFKIFKAHVENQTKRTIKVLRSDNGLEYCNKEFADYMNKFGIIHQKSNLYTPQQNGLCERFNRTIVEKARCLLFDANLSKEFWAEATNTAVYLQNRIVAATLDNKTPFELWTGSKPDISHIRIFGSTVMVHVAKEKRRKWDKKAVKCILMGYPDNIKGYRVYNPETRNISTSRDVIIIEKESKPEHFIEVQDQDIDSVGECKNPDDTEQQETDSITNNSESSVDSFQDVNDETYVPTDYEDSDSILKDDGNRSPQCLNKRIRKVPDRYGFSNLCVDNETYVDAAGLSLHDALNGPERTQWESAMSEELQCFKDNDAWELSDPPKDGTVVQCKWVLCKKYDSENKVRFRARLVAKGYSQIEGVDFTETFSPVVRHTTLRLLFALSVQLGLSTTHLDVTTAFLNGTLDKTIYMKIPKGFSEKTQNGQVLKLKKAIYGLKQSSRAWYKKVDECLLNMGYVKSKIEPCMFTKMSQGQKTIVTLFVDDFFVFSNDVKETNYLKHALASKFKIKDLGEIRKCLGVNNYGLKYSADGSSILEGFVDADWGANTIDRRSYTGVCFTLSGCVISWETRKQKTVALSSSEAEYMAITEACKEAVYLRNLQKLKTQSEELIKTMALNFMNRNYVKQTPVNQINPNQTEEHLELKRIHLGKRHKLLTYLYTCAANDDNALAYCLRKPHVTRTLSSIDDCKTNACILCRNNQNFFHGAATSRQSFVMHSSCGASGGIKRWDFTRAASATNIPLQDVSMEEQDNSLTVHSLHSSATQISAEKKLYLDQLLSKAIFVTGSQFSIVEHPLWITFFNEIQPSYKLPTRKAISTTHLEVIYNEMVKAITEELKSTNDLHVQCDGWSNQRNEGIINFIIAKPEPFFVKSLNTLTNRHTSQYLSQEIIKVMEIYGGDKFVTLIGDNVNSIQKAFQMVKNTYTHVLPLRCVAHTLNLLCEDCLKSEPVKAFISIAVETIKAIKRSQAMNVLLAQIIKNKGSGETLKLPGKTRWGSYCTALKRIRRIRRIRRILKNSKVALQTLAVHEDATISEEIKSNILELNFWSMIEHCIKLLEPITRKIFKLEGNGIHINEVYMAFKDIKSTLNFVLPEISILDEQHKQDIINNVIKRTDNCMKPIHYAAYMLDLKSQGIELDEEHEVDAMEYIHEVSQSLNIDVGLDSANYRAKEGLWDPRVAVRILNAPCTSAATERSFSTHAHIHSHKRNRLTTNRAAKVAYISYNWNLLHKHKDEDNDEDDEPLSSPKQLSSPITSPIYEEQPSRSSGNQKEMEFCDVLRIDCDNKSDDSD